MEEELIVDGGWGVGKMPYRKFIRLYAISVILVVVAAAVFYRTSDSPKWFLANGWWMMLLFVPGMLIDSYWRIRKAKKQTQSKQESQAKS